MIVAFTPLHLRLNTWSTNNNINGEITRAKQGVFVLILKLNTNGRASYQIDFPNPVGNQRKASFPSYTSVLSQVSEGHEKSLAKNLNFHYTPLYYYPDNFTVSSPNFDVT